MNLVILCHNRVPSFLEGSILSHIFQCGRLVCGIHDLVSKLWVQSMSVSVDQHLVVFIKSCFSDQELKFVSHFFSISVTLSEGFQLPS